MNVAIRHDTPSIPSGFTGTWRSWHNLTTLRHKGRYEKGLPVGTHYTWYANGSKCSMDVYEGTKNTRSQMWYRADESGRSKLQVESDFTGDPIRVVTYYKNGQKRKDSERSRIKRTVVVREWDEQGHLISETTNRIGQDIQQPPRRDSERPEDEPSRTRQE